MRFLPTRVHGLIAYAWGVLLALSPFVLGFARDKTALWMAIAFGVVGILYSLLTDYELGAFKLLPMPVHLILDALAGAVLVVLSFALRLDSRASWIFLLFGLFAVAASLITRTHPADRTGTTVSAASRTN
jgi:uncharacterized membrane protein HdeD (DUF308 family)